MSPASGLLQIFLFISSLVSSEYVGFFNVYNVPFVDTFRLPKEINRQIAYNSINSVHILYVAEWLSYWYNGGFDGVYDEKIHYIIKVEI